VQLLKVATMSSVTLTRAALRQRHLAVNAVSAAVGPALQRGVNRVTTTWASAGSHSGALRRVPAPVHHDDHHSAASSAEPPVSFTAAAAPRVIPWPAAPGVDVIKMACESQASGPVWSTPELQELKASPAEQLAFGAAAPAFRARAQARAHAAPAVNRARLPTVTPMADAAASLSQGVHADKDLSFEGSDGLAETRSSLVNSSYSARAEVVFQSVWSRMEAEGCLMSFPTEVVWLNGAPGSGKVC